MPSIVVEQSKPGYEADAAAVQREFDKLPAKVAEQFVRSRVRLVACRGSVVDHFPDMSGKRPREWPADKTWDIVPGAYVPNKHTVVVATIAGAGGRIVPPFGVGHGSASLAIHEMLHGLDYSVSGLVSGKRSFRDAWSEDRDVLKIGYFKHPVSGPEESFAESGARSFGRAGILKDEWPNLRDYWFQDRIEPFSMSGGKGARQMPSHGASGFGRKRPDGSVELFLTALGDQGEIGHGMVTIEAPDELSYGGLEVVERAAAAGVGEYDFFDLPPTAGH